MKYSVFLQLKMQDGKYTTLGTTHIIPWNYREFIHASSGWFIINQDRQRLASEMIPVMQKGIVELTQRPQHYNNYEMLLGLGTIKSVLKFYSDLLEDCRQYPYAELGGCIIN